MFFFSFPTKGKINKFMGFAMIVVAWAKDGFYHHQFSMKMFLPSIVKVFLNVYMRR